MNEYPLSVRPIVSRRRRRPLSVRQSRCPSRRRRTSSVRPSHRVSTCPVVVLCPSVRPVVGPVLVVRPLSIRPRPSVVVVRPLSVRPVVRLITTYMTSRSILRTGIKELLLT